MISFGGAFVIVVQNDPWMALIALMGAPISFLSSRYSAKRMRDFQRDNQNVASDRTVFDQETFQNLQFIKAFGMLDRVTEKFHRIQQESVDIALKQNKFQQSMTIVTSLVGQAVGYACYGFAAFRLWQGEISYGTMTMFVSMAGSLRGSFSGILGLLPMVIRAGISAERIMEITSLPRDSMEDKEEAEEIRRQERLLPSISYLVVKRPPGAPARAQRSGSRGERRSNGMSELSLPGGSEGYGVCDDATTRPRPSPRAAPAPRP